MAALYRGVRQWLLDRGNGQWRDEVFTAASLRRDLRSTLVIVATLRGRIVGAAYVQRRDPQLWPDRPASEAVYIHRLVVSRRLAGRGVAEGLLSVIAAIARRNRRWRLRLDCAPLEPLARIYCRLGFRFVDEADFGAGYRVFRFERSRAQLSTRHR